MVNDALYLGIVYSEPYLAHFGVKGMHWGVHKSKLNADTYFSNPRDISSTYYRNKRAIKKDGHAIRSKAQSDYVKNNLRELAFRNMSYASGNSTSPNAMKYSEKIVKNELAKKYGKQIANMYVSKNITAERIKTERKPSVQQYYKDIDTIIKNGKYRDSDSLTKAYTEYLRKTYPEDYNLE